MNEQPNPQSKRFSPLTTLLIALVILGAAGLVVALGVFEAKNTNDVTQTNTNTADGNQNTPSTNSPNVNTGNTNTGQTGTEGWKTYSSKQYGFSVQYPPSWTLSDTHRFCEKMPVPLDGSCTNLLVSFPMSRSTELPTEVRVPEPYFHISYLGDNATNLPLTAWRRETKGWAEWDAAEVNGVPVVIECKLSFGEYQNDLSIDFTSQGKVFEMNWYDGGYTDQTNFNYAVKVMQSLSLK